MDKTCFDAVVLAAGDFPTHPLPVSLLDHPRVVCCDSAAREFLASGRRPWRAVGDGDSIDEHTRSLVPFVCESEQETNDLTKAMRMLHREGMPRVAIVGATGKREDHTLGNISLLVEYMRWGMEVEMITDHGIFLPAKGSRTFHARQGQQVSIINFTCARMYATGLVWQLPKLTNWWMGTLNQTEADSFTIEADGEYLVYMAF